MKIANGTLPSCSLYLCHVLPFVSLAEPDTTYKLLPCSHFAAQPHFSPALCWAPTLNCLLLTWASSSSPPASCHTLQQCSCSSVPLNYSFLTIPSSLNILINPFTLCPSLGVQFWVFFHHQYGTSSIVWMWRFVCYSLTVKIDLRVSHCCEVIVHQSISVPWKSSLLHLDCSLQVLEQP